MAKNSLSRTQVEHIAKLALLPLTVKETPIFQDQLSEVVEYVGKIQEVHSAQGISRACHFVVVHRSTEGKVGRKDVVGSGECLTQEEAASGTENKHNGLFVVPAIFEES